MAGPQLDYTLDHRRWSVKIKALGAAQLREPAAPLRHILSRANMIPPDLRGNLAKIS